MKQRKPQHPPAQVGGSLQIGVTDPSADPPCHVFLLFDQPVPMITLTAEQAYAIGHMIIDKAAQAMDLLNNSNGQRAVSGPRRAQ